MRVKWLHSRGPATNFYEATGRTLRPDSSGHDCSEVKSITPGTLIVLCPSGVFSDVVSKD